MKSIIRIIILLITIIPLLMAFTCAHANTLPVFIHTDNSGEGALKLSIQDAESVNTPTFELPTSLKVIEDEAFEGTALVMVDLPETVEEIGDRAFANISSLHLLKIPEKTRKIGKDILDGSNLATITATSGSYARTWARENGIPFSPITVMYADAGVQPAGSVFLKDTATSDAIPDDNTLAGQDDRPTGRHHDELNASKYQGYVVFNILGRAPPAAG